MLLFVCLLFEGEVVLVTVLLNYSIDSRGMIAANEVIYFYFRGKHIMPHKIIMVSGIEM